jgi:hypothetical protein
MRGLSPRGVRAPAGRFARRVLAAACVAAALLAGARVARAGPERPPKSPDVYGSGKVHKPEFKDLVRRSDLIVVGRVVQVGRIPRPGPQKNRPKTKRYAYWEDRFAVLEIQETVKGSTPKGRVKIAFHSDLEGDKTDYQAGRQYVAFLIRPGKYPDAYTTAHFHYGQYRVNDQGKAERVADPSEISKPTAEVVAKVRAVLRPPASSR